MKVLTLAQKMVPALIGLSAVLAGCGGLGNGVLPVSASIQPFGGLVGAPTAKAFTCLTTGLSFFVTFSNGASGNFTSRATYSSSNPGVLQVSNLDIPVPGQANTFYARGTLVPVATGTTTITVQYLTFVRTIEMTVAELQNFRVSPASADLAAKSQLDLAVFGDLDGVTTPLDSVVTWSFVTPDTTIANIDSVSGTMTGVAVGKLTARALIPACGKTQDAAVTVATLQSLALSREFGSNSNLIVKTTERLIATGTLDSGKTQDLSTQVSYTSSAPDALYFLPGSLLNIAIAAEDKGAAVQVGAKFPDPAITAPDIDITPIAASLNTISVTPTSVDVPAGLTTQFNAIGSFTGSSSQISQDITRHVAWSSSDLSVVSVQTLLLSSFNGFAGLAATVSSAAGKTATVTATANSAAGTPTAVIATLNVK